MDSNMKLCTEIDRLFNKWVTSIDEQVSEKSFKQLYQKLKKMTDTIIKSEFGKVWNDRNDIFHEMLERTIIAIKAGKIKTVDFFSSWYRQSLKNYLINYIKHRNRKKRKSIKYEAELAYDISKYEGSISVDAFNQAEQEADLRDFVFNCLCHDEQYSILKERYVNGLTIKELADIHNTTTDNIYVKIHRSIKKIKKNLIAV